MKHIISTEMSLNLDRNTRESMAIDDSILMEKASIRLWDILQSIIQKEKPQHFVFICGKGDNGGDGLAVARHAWSSGIEKDKLHIFVAQELGSVTHQRQLASLRAIGLSVSTWKAGCLEQLPCRDAKKCAIIDAILGTGIRGAAYKEALEMIQGINNISETQGNTGAVVISLDVPSGAGDWWIKGYPIVRADYTITLAPAKLALYYPEARHCAGKIYQADDVFPHSLVQNLAESCSCLLQESDIHQNLPHLADDAYKISRGRVTVLAGTVGTLGAALLCTKATQSAGAGYVQFFIQDEAYSIAAPFLPAIMSKPESTLKIEDLRADVVLAGPGWGKSEEHVRLLSALLESDFPLVLDADALRILAEHDSSFFLDAMQKRSAPLVMTPHPGEFNALVRNYINSTENRPFPEVFAQLAKTMHAIIVYKSHVTWICSPDEPEARRFSIWDGQCPGLGTAGSGDVLAGFLAGDLALRYSAYKSTPCDLWKIALQSAHHAVVCHGYAGRRLYEDEGWFSAEALLPILKKISCPPVEKTQ